MFSSLLLVEIRDLSLKILYSIDSIYFMKEPAAGENFGGLVVVKLLRDNLVEIELIVIQLETYNMFQNGVFSQNYSVSENLLLLKFFSCQFCL